MLLPILIAILVTSPDESAPSQILFEVCEPVVREQLAPSSAPDRIASGGGAVLPVTQDDMDRAAWRGDSVEADRTYRLADGQLVGVQVDPDGVFCQVATTRQPMVEVDRAAATAGWLSIPPLDLDPRFGGQSRWLSADGRIELRIHETRPGGWSGEMMRLSTPAEQNLANAAADRRRGKASVFY